MSIGIKKSGRVNRILVTGGLGQVGTEFYPHFCRLYGEENVLLTDIREPDFAVRKFEILDALDKKKVKRVVDMFKPDCVFHLSAILSANGEKNPELAYRINVDSFKIMIDIVKDIKGATLMTPSTIAVFGPEEPNYNVPDLKVLRPTTMYGVTKVFMENLGAYYNKKFGLNFRSLRYPGVLSAGQPGGGTTDYAVDIFAHAVQHKPFSCFLSENTALPMMHVEDMIRGTLEFLETDDKNLTQRVYNFGAIHFTPKEIYEAIKKHYPDFEITYKPDFRQAIADSWPKSLDFSMATKDWGWKPHYNMDNLVVSMLEGMKELYPVPEVTPKIIPEMRLSPF